MSPIEFIVHWNELHRYDSWWRRKHGIAFNSREHRESNQYDIAIEYMENRLEEKTIIRITEQQNKKKEYEKTGEWIKQNDELFKKIDLSQFNE